MLKGIAVPPVLAPSPSWLTNRIIFSNRYKVLLLTVTHVVTRGGLSYVVVVVLEGKLVEYDMFWVLGSILAALSRSVCMLCIWLCHGVVLDIIGFTNGPKDEGLGGNPDDGNCLTLAVPTYFPRIGKVMCRSGPSCSNMDSEQK